MVQFGELQIPPLINGKSKNLENGLILPEGVKELRKNRWISFLICVLIFIGISSRCAISNYNGYDFMAFYFTFSVLCFVLLPLNVPEKHEILSMKTFAKTGAKVLCFIEFSFAVAAISMSAPVEIFPVMLTNIVTSILVTYLCSHFRIFNYRPLKNNDSYMLSRTIHKTCDGIIIKESRSFSIVLENSGKETIPFTGLSLERLTVSVYGRSFVRFQLPHKVTINSGQTIKVVPETEKNEALLSALSIPGFCSFGLDTGEIVSTRLTSGKKTISLMEEHFEHISDANNSKGFDCVTEVVNTEEGVKTVEIKC